MDGIYSSSSRNGVEIGNRFRPSGPTAFGSSVQRIWQVREIVRGPEGLPHVRLFDCQCPSTTKTLSVKAILDKTLFGPEA